MFERKPQIKIEQREDRDHQEIPLFEKLDRDSQEFVAEIYDLSNMSEQEFLAQYPKIKNLAKQSREYWGQKDASSSTIWSEFASALGDITGRNLPWPEQVADKRLFFATMQDLVLLHLLELKDFANFGQPGFYSKQTDYAAEKILQQTKEMKLPFLNLSMPDALQSKILTIQQEELPSETAEKIKLIHIIINTLHDRINYGFPPALLFVKDLWRYAIIRMKKTKGIDFYDWAKQYGDFFNKLSNINLRKTNE